MSEILRPDRIALLARQNQGKQNLPAFLAALSEAIGFSVRADQLLNLQSTDPVLADFRAGYASVLSGEASSTRAFFSQDEGTTAWRIPWLLASSLGEEMGFLWIKQSDTCGAVILGADQVLRRCEEILTLDGDTVSLLSEDHTQGFMFDRNADDATEAFEVIVWGSRCITIAAVSEW